jgi:excisionase family DNA binding protein
VALTPWRWRLTSRRPTREARAATYHQLWWPPHDQPVYVDRLPIWTDRGYTDPTTGELLPTWDQALNAVDPDAEPAHVGRFGDQDNIQGLTAGTPGAERAIGYLCKYVNKAIGRTYDDGDVSPARAAHIDRLAEEVRWLPCAPTCANWLRYGIQPAAAQAGMVPGHCKHKAHDRDHLGLGGRRVLVSRQWCGKTLAGHKADRAAVVRAALEEAGIDPDDHDEMSVAGTDGCWSWELLGRSRVDAPTYAAAISQVIRTRQRWRAETTRPRRRSLRLGRASAAGRGVRSAIRQVTSEGEGLVEIMTTSDRGRVLLRPEEVAQALSISRSTVFLLMRSGELRSVKIGKSRRVPVDAVTEYVAALSA